MTTFCKVRACGGYAIPGFSRCDYHQEQLEEVIEKCLKERRLETSTTPVQRKQEIS